MLKNLIIAALSALVGVIITKHFADKTVIELQRENARKEHDTFSYAFSAGWDGGKEEGRRQIWTETLRNDGKLPESYF